MHGLRFVRINILSKAIQHSPKPHWAPVCFLNCAVPTCQALRINYKPQQQRKQWLLSGPWLSSPTWWNFHKLRMLILLSWDFYSMHLHQKQIHHWSHWRITRNTQVIFECPSVLIGPGLRGFLGNGRFNLPSRNSQVNWRRHSASWELTCLWLQSQNIHFHWVGLRNKWSQLNEQVLKAEHQTSALSLQDPALPRTRAAKYCASSMIPGNTGWALCVP